MTWFPERFGVSRNFVSIEYAYLTDFIPIALLAIMVAAGAAKPDFRLSRSRTFVCFVGIVATLCFCAQFGPFFDASSVSEAGVAAVECLYKVTSVAVLLLWLEQANRFDARSIAAVIGVACFLLAVFGFLVLGMKSVLSQVLFMLSPAVSMGALVVFLRLWDSAGAREESDQGRPFAGKARTLLPTLVLSFGVLLVTLVGSSIQTYVRHSDPAAINSTLFGFFDAVGLLLTAVVLIGTAVSTYWCARMRDVLLITPSLLALAYVLSIAMPEGQLYLTYLPLAMARRLSIVFWFIAAAACPRRYVAVATTMLAVYRAAQTAGITPFLLGAFDYLSTAYSLLVIVEIAVLAAFCPLIASVCLHRTELRSGWERRSAPAGSEELVADVEQKGVARIEEQRASEAAVREDARRKALEGVAAKYGLSRREGDVLALLAEGWRAAAIAERLVLSVATVKNHMNHIYGKLGVHSQDELLELIEQERRAIFERETRERLN